MTIQKTPLSQTGTALVVSLILLTVLTLLAVSASQTTRMQERMAGNARDTDLAFQAAEAGVRNAESYIADLTAAPSTCSTPSSTCYVYQPGVLPLDLSSNNLTWWTTNGKEYGTQSSQDMTALARDPMYVIEELAFVRDDLTEGNGPPSGKYFYRTSSSGAGGTDSAAVVVQTTYTRRY